MDNYRYATALRVPTGALVAALRGAPGDLEFWAEDFDEESLRLVQA
jgi:hypothetical protein